MQQQIGTQRRNMGKITLIAGGRSKGASNATFMQNILQAPAGGNTKIWYDKLNPAQRAAY